MYRETDLLALVVGEAAAQAVTEAPGGWRTLSAHEIDSLGLKASAKAAVLALQELTCRGFPRLTGGELADATTVGDVYGQRLAGLEHEVVIAIAVDGRNQLLGEFEVARGGRHGAALTPADVLRPMIRAGAAAAVLVHNQPSGDPTPSEEDVRLTKTVRNSGLIIGLPLLDHVIVAGRGGGSVSLRARGILEEL
jgi:DNA repair protein RadC